MNRTVCQCYTLKTGMPVEEGDSNLKLLRVVSLSETKIGCANE